VPFQSFLDLRSVFRDDARDTYEDLLDRRRGEHIRAFALVTDDDVMGASGAGDTAERLAKRLTTRQPRNLAEERYHEWEFGWHTGEWDDIYTNEHPCTKQPRIGAKEYIRGMMSFQQQWVSQTGRSEHAFKRHALRAMVDALADLDAEGLFGAGQLREGITVFVEITDSDDSDIVKLKTARMLNPPRAARRLTAALPVTGRLLVSGMNMVGWFRRGRLIAGRSAK
jgi:hypothetical protein